MPNTDQSERMITRRKLPDTRQSITHKFRVGEHKGYLNVGLYEDGTPGEVFVTMDREGSTIGGLMDSFAAMTSIALQYGVPLESLVKKFSYQRFEPSGHTPNPEIKYAHSVVDYIFRWLGLRFGFTGSPILLGESNQEVSPFSTPDLPVLSGDQIIRGVMEDERRRLERREGEGDYLGEENPPEPCVG